VWVDFDVLRTSFRREGIVSSVRVKLASPAQFELFQASVEQDKRVGLQALREQKFYEKQSEGTSTFIGIVGTAIAIVFSVGAMIGAMITMYAAVANRQKEIGVLRALGFSRRSVLTSFLLESLLLALIGGALGTLASLGMGFVKFSMMNFSSWSEMVFSFDPTFEVIGTALAFAGIMGLIGGFLPALRAARVSAVTAMRGG
jgi:putative ABC transport system permease protein